ncbi:hypothetical protein AB6A40_005352 [Gnathostoma spinigerum]|uniref:Uncharacterized protein n=1 Tax=Gnathostoma spinigerum TaxID=75299 RepID=A0ABD6ENT4_9BILA
MLEGNKKPRFVHPKTINIGCRHSITLPSICRTQIPLSTICPNARHHCIVDSSADDPQRHVTAIIHIIRSVGFLHKFMADVGLNFDHLFYSGSFHLPPNSIRQAMSQLVKHL